MSKGHNNIAKISNGLLTGMMLAFLSLTGLTAQVGGPPVTWLSATPGNGSVDLSWDPVVDANLNKYIILRGT
ncbi:MAG: hypothetical protein GXO90_00325, partial [FCB group bacterium]|nr:hypothetical protein [FCB group bacterium]